MATVFWDSEGVVLVDFLESKKTVTGANYVDVLRKLRAKLAEKSPGNLHCGILFHHDNAPAHSSRIVRDVLRFSVGIAATSTLIAQTCPI